MLFQNIVSMIRTAGIGGAGLAAAYAVSTDRASRESHTRLVRCVATAGVMLADYSAVLRRKRRLERMEASSARRVDDVVLAWCARIASGAGDGDAAFRAADSAASAARGSTLASAAAAVVAATRRNARGAAAGAAGVLVCAALSEGLHLPIVPGSGEVAVGATVCADLMVAAHARNSLRLKRTLFANRGIYIKIGQHLGLLDYLIPKEYVAAMRGTFDDAPRSSFEDVVAVLEASLGCPVGEIFESIEETPLASASLAQVHRALLKEGKGGRLGPPDGTDGVAFISSISFSDRTARTVAVKVQHRGLREASDTEIRSLELLMRAVIWLRPDFPFKWLVEELKDKLPKELDFRLEAANSEECARRVKERFGSAVVVPAVYSDLTSPQVMVMEFAPGCQVSDAAEIERQGLAPRAVARLMSEVFYDQVCLQFVPLVVIC